MIEVDQDMLEQQSEQLSVIRPIERTSSMNTSTFSTNVMIAVLALSVLVGVGTGYVFAQGASGGKKGSTAQSSASGSVKTEKSAGVKDVKRFPDSAQGKLVEGGIEGEGSFHLERPGGESQNVYLTSSIVDLSEYVGKKVKVMGETFQGQKAGWLMDVGYVELK